MKTTFIVLATIFVSIVLLIDTKALGDESIKTDLATLGIQASGHHAVRTMAENARVFINRKSTFTQVPKFLQGLQYSVRRFIKKTVSVSCRVKTSGLMYLCLFNDITPKDIGQRNQWEKCGTMTGPGPGGKNVWTIYSANVQAGQILTFPAPDKYGLTVAAKIITKDKTRPLPKMPTTVSAYRQLVGKSVKERPVECFVFGKGQDVTFIMAAIHGHEHMGIQLVQRLAVHLQEHKHLLQDRKVILLPIANPDGVAYYSRTNMRRIDLNRNFPATNRKKIKSAGRQPLSEPEARVINQLIQKYSPNRIISIHQTVGITGPKTEGLVDYDGPGKKLANHMAQYCKLPVKKWGTKPGSLGSYAGVDLGIPIITLELPKFDVGLTSEELWKKYGTTLIAAVVYPEKTK